MTCPFYLVFVFILNTPLLIFNINFPNQGNLKTNIKNFIFVISEFAIRIRFFLV